MDDREFVKYTFLIVAAVAVVGLLNSGSSMTGMLSLEKFTGLQAKENCKDLFSVMDKACIDAKPTDECLASRKALEAAGCIKPATKLPKLAVADAGSKEVVKSAKTKKVAPLKYERYRGAPAKKPSSYARAKAARAPAKKLGTKGEKKVRPKIGKNPAFKSAYKKPTSTMGTVKGKAVRRQAAKKPVRKYSKRTCDSVHMMTAKVCDENKASFSKAKCEDQMAHYNTKCGGVAGAKSFGEAAEKAPEAKKEEKKEAASSGASGPSGSPSADAPEPKKEEAAAEEKEEAAPEAEEESEEAANATVSASSPNATGPTGAVVAAGEGSGDFSNALFAVLIGVVGLFLYSTRNQRNTRRRRRRR